MGGLPDIGHVRLFFLIRDLSAPLGTDVISHQWPWTFLYAFSPVDLTLNRVRREGLSLIRVAPYWPKTTLVPF